MLVFTVLLLGAIFGLTWSVVLALKDTKSTVRLLLSPACLQPVKGAACMRRVQEALVSERLLPAFSLSCSLSLTG